MIALDTSTTSAARRGWILAVLLIGQLMATLESSIVSVAAQTIREELGASGAAIQLIVSGYLLTTGVLLVTCARLGDIAGHRRVFLAGLGWFTAASLLCGLAPNPTVLVLARIAQAVGAALLMPQVFSLIQLYWDGEARRRVVGIYSMVLALGVVLGQVVGGLVVGADLFGLGWRPAFLLNIPIGVIALVIGARTLPTGRTDGAARLDPAGVALLPVAMTAFTLPLIFGREYGWPAWAWMALAGGGLLLAAFVRYERNSRHPVLDLAVLRPPGVKPGLIACCLVMGCYSVFVLTLTLHLQSALGFSPLRAGSAFAPFAIGFGALSLTWTRYPQRVQRLLPTMGPIAFAAGSITLALILVRDQWHPLLATPLLLFAGAGHAAGYSPLIARLTTLVEARHASALSALDSTGPMLTAVTTVAGLGSVYFAAPSSADGLLRVAIAVAILLAVTAVCAARSGMAAVGNRAGAAA
ncbi:MFS transporter [Nocardia crassostreae]|uniref:MFS transporter n=1 Tax=Nocardia crassostreae TaxID=53428 RepID=UPI000829BE06|nr:MFS transporter [Nocardia crassostreae]